MYLLEQGHDPSKIVLAASSAGAGLSLALLMSIRDMDLPFPAGAYLMAPWVLFWN